ncbi:hypothetical protein [Laceyella tengchongensis]|uniref:hypothetical protein n=1 Tax=Laceyella tengchongensis TaxID=574699 RepID=UPI0016703731|nr:hypothetical protein [Laceyella tengchongensis]
MVNCDWQATASWGAWPICRLHVYRSPFWVVFTYSQRTGLWGTGQRQIKSQEGMS